MKKDSCQQVLSGVECFDIDFFKCMLWSVLSYVNRNVNGTGTILIIILVT